MFEPCHGQAFVQCFYHFQFSPPTPYYHYSWRRREARLIEELYLPNRKISTPQPYSPKLSLESGRLEDGLSPRSQVFLVQILLLNGVGFRRF